MKRTKLLRLRPTQLAFLFGAALALTAYGEPGPAGPTADSPAPAASAGAAPVDGTRGSGLDIGPKLTVVGAPTIFRVGVETRWEGRWGLSIDYGFTPSIRIDDYDGKATSWMVAARYYPWKGAFYVGLGAGKQSVRASHGVSFPGETITVTTDNDALVVVPQIGWRFVWNSGFYLGFEVGMQVALSSSTTSTSNASYTVSQSPSYATALAQVNQKVNDFAKLPLPQVALLQVGWFF